MDPAIKKVRYLLKNGASEAARKSAERYFRDEVKLYGLKSADVHRIGRETFKEISDKSRPHILLLCEELWKSGYLEESLVACNWSESLRKASEKDDMLIYGYWLDSYVNNWASCDTFCNHTVGDLLMKYPENIMHIRAWALSSNRWMKRGAAVSLIIPARKGLFAEDIFGIASVLLRDGDDMVQKGYGWMLKAASEARMDEVFRFVMRNKRMMPRTALRYAIEKMTAVMKAEAMAK